MQLNSDYWQERYQQGATGWDIGYASTPLVEYFAQLKDKNVKILIPGAGNAYEVEYLFSKGFQQVHMLDYSKYTIEQFRNSNPDFPKEQLFEIDFFEHTGQYDLIVEQTFFCAIDPSLREKYVTKCNELLKDEGKIVGLLWDDPMNDDRPPFGGNKEIYVELFKDQFIIDTLEACYNSIKPRAGKELFMKFIKKQEAPK